MLGNEEIIRELYAAGEGQGTDIEKFVSMFSEEGYMLDIPSGTKFRGQALATLLPASQVHFLMSTVSCLASTSRRTSSLSNSQFGERIKVSWPLLLDL
jgi:hypothetical protein